MSLQISVYYGEDTLLDEINWARNPFGLCNWVRDNEAVAGLEVVGDLWDVCNQWAYDKASEIDRALFKQVIDAHDIAVQGLTEGYYVFDLPGFIQFIAPFWDRIATEKRFGTQFCPGQKYLKDGRIALPMTETGKIAYTLHLGYATLDAYKDWMKRLVHIADLLQDPATRFYCSN